MSKILISFYQQIFANDVKNMAIFYESLAKELVSSGNDVKILNNYLIRKNWTDNVDIDQKNKEILIDSIKNFNPDLIIAFNNQICDEILANTNCPIIIYYADSIDFFTEKHLINKYKDRYYYITNIDEKSQTDKIRELGFNDDRILFLRAPTAIRNEKLEKTKNISFIGSNFNNDFSLLECNSKLYNILLKFWNESNYDQRDLIALIDKKEGIDENIYNFTVFDTRTTVLNSILDLGLSLYGKGFDRLPNEFFALKSAFIRDEVFSLKHNQDIYNSSKISISISHPQCYGYGFPWRIYDIMASNSLCISSYSKLLEKETEGFVNIPMYTNPYEARELCKKYLNEPHLCEDIIAASNEFVEKNCRWINNFKIIQEIVGTKLINSDMENKSYDFLIKESLVKKEKENIRILKKLKKIYYYFIFILVKILIFHPFANYDRILKKIDKYKKL